ncbi:MAG: hypothetical protein PF483_15850 [Halothiobacillus sp.]|uniref:hypothetical protein n=1 Tax=Halothiobacillus sp. TaxID=1891311 RepID=UPI002AD46A61|nr:hypothetical protein [Halothiobacillus sp.]MDA3878540.1 hypothetical protein [Halothiobacillus sp.]
MNKTPSSQICVTHQALIAAMVEALGGNGNEEAARQLITQYREDGWVNLANQLENWLHGAEPSIAALDEEDQQILEGILHTQADPAWLSTLAGQARIEAAEGIAQLIVSATWGDPAALELLSNLREAAMEDRIEGSLAHAFIAMVEGERDIDQLTHRFPGAESALLGTIMQRVCGLEAE